MRLFLIPVSTRRTLLYAQRLQARSEGSSLADKGSRWAARTWTQWEKKEGGWQRRVADYGNQALRRIPFEEWGLKSVPPLTASERKRRDAVELVFPASAMGWPAAREVATRLATERQALHRRRLMWCVVGMPVVAPLALVPLIPNIPFFFLAYRAWSHWRALRGGDHVLWLVRNDLVVPAPSTALDALYAGSTLNHHHHHHHHHHHERALLSPDQARHAQVLNLPALEAELERAIWQVARSIQRERAKT